MLALAGLEADPAAALADGRALDRYRSMIAAQGGDPDAALPRAAHVQTVTAAGPGWLRRLDARAVGVAAWRLGAGRARKEDPVSAARRGALPGQAGGAGRGRRSRCWSCAPTTSPGSRGPSAALEGAIEIGDQPPAAGPLVIERIAGH